MSSYNVYEGKVDDVLISTLVPNPHVVNLRDTIIGTTTGPFFFTLEYWVKTAAGASGDGFSVQLDWTDLLGIARSVGGAILPVAANAASGSYFVSSSNLVVSLNGTSPVTMTAKDFGGLPGASTYGYRLVHVGLDVPPGSIPWTT